MSSKKAKYTRQDVYNDERAREPGGDGGAGTDDPAEARDGEPRAGGRDYDSASSDSTAAAFPVLVCVPDTANTALAFFRQLTALSAHGIRVVAVTPAGYRTAESFASGLDLFVTSVLRKTGVHFFGVGLGA